jgi:hypothetical protein
MARLNWIAVCCALTGALTVASPALAIKLGHYSGTTADGHTILFVVAKDPNTNAPELSSLTINYSAHCAQTGDTYNSGTGYGIANGHDFVKGRIVFSEHTLFAYNRNLITFTSNTAAKGTTLYTVGALGSGTPPKRSQLCTSPEQAFSASWQGP